MLQQPARGYHENIVDHYENPRNVGSLDKNDPNVGTVGVSVFRRVGWGRDCMLPAPSPDLDFW